MRCGRGTLSRLAVLMLAVSGCAETTSVTTEVVHPAEVPVRSFPRVWVGAGHLPAEEVIADALVRHLAADRTVEVRRVDVEDLEPLRQEARIPAGTAVVILDLELRDRTRTEWTTRPETVCGPYGCYTQHRSYLYDVPVLRAELTMTVYDGPSARVLQRATAKAEDEGRPHPALRRRVAKSLAKRLREMVDQRTEPVKVKLLHVELERVDRAIEAIRQGRWHRGRLLLEAAVRSEAGRSLEPPARARLLYDLGQARRFDPETLDDPEAHFAAAERALQRAVVLHARPLYRAALQDMERHREQVRLVREQRRATERNQRLGRQGEGADIPDPPPSYQ